MQPEFQTTVTGDAVDVRHTVLIALIILAGSLLRLFMLTNQSLWFDEGQSLLMTDSGTIAGTLLEMASHTGGDKYQPLYFCLLYTSPSPRDS